MKYFIAITLILVYLSSCSNDQDNCDLPEPDYFEIGVSNSKGVSLINGIFQRDSFKLYNSSELIYLKPLRFGGDSTLLIIRYPDIISDVDYWLELDSSVIDTFNFKFIRRSNDILCSVSKMSEIEYNGTTHIITNDEPRFYFIRDD